MTVALRLTTGDTLFSDELGADEIGAFLKNFRYIPNCRGNGTINGQVPNICVRTRDIVYWYDVPLPTQYGTTFTPDPALVWAKKFGSDPGRKD